VEVEVALLLLVAVAVAVALLLLVQELGSKAGLLATCHATQGHAIILAAARHGVQILISSKRVAFSMVMQRLVHGHHAVPVMR
jgi:hypothetical protein